MYRRITRRDFLNGVSIAVGGSALASSIGELPAMAAGHSGAYPPALTGMRGSYDATYAVAHSLRDGTFWDSAGKVEDTGETYDLIVVGAGISGLSAAYFFRKATSPKARILVLDNHDDFGGHAKRNEFRVGKRLLLSNAGTQSIESPSAYSAVSKELLSELGIDTHRFYRAYDQKLYSQLGTACFFDKETFAEDRLVAGMRSLAWPDFLRRSPLSEKVREDIARLYTQKVDYLPGLSREERRARLSKISYADFLTKICNVDSGVLPFFQSYSHDLYAVGIDGISTLACYESTDDYGAFNFPGFQGMDLGEPEQPEPYIFHFPDGNASVARLLVRSLIPGAIPGHTMEDVVTARVDYSRLDQTRSAVRIRLNSTAVKARHVGDPESGKQVEVTYVRDGKLQSAKTTNCILACYNGMVPYLCAELPEKQKEALHYGVKQPLIYTHVAIRNWTAFNRLGIRQIVSPGSYHSFTMLDFPVNLGEYRSPSAPQEPMVLFMLRVPCKPGLPRREQYRMGRFELLNTPFSMFERNIRDQLQRMLGGAGFDSARDIAAITVNRWAHGYAYDYDPLSDPDFPPEQLPCVLGRKRFGRISIANSDAGARAFTDEAIDQAYRAVQEQVKTG